MKKIIAIAALIAATSASAGFFNNNSNNLSPSYQNDNGIFAYNGNDFWDPRWYAQEFTNMVNEFDEPTHAKGSREDNGIFAYNGNDYWDPRWYSQEFMNLANEIDEDVSNDQYGYKPNSRYEFAVTTK
jgi:hypothetical protein